MMGLPRGVADALDAITYSRRALAYLQLDAELTLVGAGGSLDNYGLGAVRLGREQPITLLFWKVFCPCPKRPFFCRASRSALGAPPIFIFTLTGDSHGWCCSTLRRSASRRGACSKKPMT
jgi:hypothetical protein